MNSMVLAQLRAMTATFLTDTCTIEARMDAQGQFGEPLQDHWALVAANVPCRVITLSSMRNTQMQIASRETIAESYKLICPYGTALAIDQRVTLANGAVYQVVDVLTKRTDETDTQATITRML
jgi:hypothetical protein